MDYNYNELITKYFSLHKDQDINNGFRENSWRVLGFNSIYRFEELPSGKLKVYFKYVYDERYRPVFDFSLHIGYYQLIMPLTSEIIEGSFICDGVSRFKSNKVINKYVLNKRVWIKKIFGFWTNKKRVKIQNRNINISFKCNSLTPDSFNKESINKTKIFLFRKKAGEKLFKDYWYHFKDGRKGIKSNYKTSQISSRLEDMDPHPSSFREIYNACKRLEIHNSDNFDNLSPNEFVRLVESSPEIRGPFYLFFDTETTGLPKDWNAPIEDLDNWPRLVQIAWIVCDGKGNKINENEYIIKPDNFTIPEKSSAVHKITTERAIQEGKRLEEVLEVFNSLIDPAEFIIAHNLNFDEKIIAAEFLRKKMQNSLSEKTKLCTMLSSVDYCKIEGPYGYKWPKLSELHINLFDENFEDAHNAKADIEATARCFWEMRKIGII